MRRFAPGVRRLGVPLAVVAVFATASLYEQEIVVKLGVATLASVRAFFPAALGVGIWISAAYFVNRLLAILLWDRLNRRVPIPRLVRDVSAVLVYLLAATGIVGVVFDQPVGTFLAASGAGAIVIGLALQNIIADVFLGLVMNFDRPFEIGDFIQIAAGPAGRVVELSWRTTRLVTAEGNLVIVPNGRLGEMVVTNFSKPDPVGEFEVSVMLDFAVPVDRALRVLTAAVRSATETAGILEEPPPKARVRGLVGQAVEYKIKYFQDPRKAGREGGPANPVAAPGLAQHEVWRAVLDQLNRAGLQPAMPKHDVHYAPLVPRQLDSRAAEDRVALLARVELFEGLTRDERTQLSVRMTERVFKEGASVIRRGEAGDSMFILCEGLLNVMIAPQEGQPERRVARLQAGAFFGEMSALTGEPRSATLVAATEVLVFEIAKDDLAALIGSRPEVAELIAQAVTARKLRNAEAAARNGPLTRAAEEKSMTAQLLGRMAAFFGVKPKPAGAVRG